MSIVALAILLIAVAAVSITLIVYLWLHANGAEANRQRLESQNTELLQSRAAALQEAEVLRTRFQGVLSAEAERIKILQELENERGALQLKIAKERESGKHWVENFNARQARMEKEHEEKQRVIEKELKEKRRAAESELKARLGSTEAEFNSLKVRLAQLKIELKPLDEEANLQSFGFYKPHYDFASSAAYQSKLEEIRAKQKKMITSKKAVVGDIEWTVNGSKAEGRKQINQTLRLLLRAFNGECDASIAKVRYNNINVMETRIRRAQEAINALAKVQQCRVTTEYLDLKMQELYLAHEYQEKLQAEKEEQRRIREQMREEEIAQRELEKARQEAERETQRYADALEQARQEAQQAVGEKHEKLQLQIAYLERQLAEAEANKERAIARAQLTRSGHVYIISNIGSFGDHVYKIGMTRRLDPMDRVRELGDASVPFCFDVHAMIYSEDAPALENTLHRLFHDRRVNAVNLRREFFYVTLDEITAAVRRHNGKIEMVKDFVIEAEAKEFRQTQATMRAQGASFRAPTLDMATNGVPH
jgi:hypothetical protein